MSLGRNGVDNSQAIGERHRDGETAFELIADSLDYLSDRRVKFTLEPIVELFRLVCRRTNDMIGL